MTNSNIIIGLAIVIIVAAGILFFIYHKPSLADIPPQGAISVAGSIACLPHADTSGPQTLECAYGLYDDQYGYYYALDSGSASESITQFQTGTKVAVQGTFKPGGGTVYDTIGTISIASIAAVGGSESSTTTNTATETTSDGIIKFTRPAQYAFAVSPQQVLVHSVVPPCEEGFDYCLYYNGDAYADTNFLSAGISIRKMPAGQDESDCLTTPPSGFADLKPSATSSTSSYAIGVFTQIGNGAAGSYSDEDEYRLFTDNTCYAINPRVGVSRVAASSSSSTASFTASDESGLMSELKDIISGFTIVLSGERIMLPQV